MILILDYGSQYTQLIARRVREQKVYCVIVPYNATLAYRKDEDEIEGIILSGGPSSVYEDEAPWLPKEVLEWNVPVLGICYGAQLLMHTLGGTVLSAKEREFGRADLQIKNTSPLFEGLEKDRRHSVWMSHGDRIEKLATGFQTVAVSGNSPYAAIEHAEKKMYGVQFHPEVEHTVIGKKILSNFLFNICHSQPTWTMQGFLKTQIESVRNLVGDKRVLCAVSGGVDSSVVAVLLNQAIGSQLVSIFVDHGLLRQSERDEVDGYLRNHFKLNLKTIDATDRFFHALGTGEEPEFKRKTIGRMFIEVFDEEAKKLDNIEFLAQGTLYPDVIESVSHRGPSQTIKSHHNVGGLPEKMNLKLIEPLRELFKDEVRALGVELGIKSEYLWRHPFPGPGLAIRVLGSVTKERVALLQKADHIFITALKEDGLYHDVWQAFAVLLPVQSVGVMGDVRTYENVCALRAVTSTDGMTADWSTLPYDFLAKVSNKIINEVRGINRVVYDISSKPPATIEWE